MEHKSVSLHSSPPFSYHSYVIRILMLLGRRSRLCLESDVIHHDVESMVIFLCGALLHKTGSIFHNRHTYICMPSNAEQVIVD